jgi:hypothetical protein
MPQCVVITPHDPLARSPRGTPLSQHSFATMPRYFFDIRDGEELIADEEGMDLPDLEAAFREAARSLAEISPMGKRNVASGQVGIVVRDASGTVMLDTAISWPSRRH